MSHFVDVGFVVLLGCLLLLGAAAVVKMRQLKLDLTREKTEDAETVLRFVGDIESFHMARGCGQRVREIMERYHVNLLILPLQSGGRVGFLLGPTGLRIFRV